MNNKYFKENCWYYLAMFWNWIKQININLFSSHAIKINKNHNSIIYNYFDEWIS
jgi:hypothetical protein